MFTGSLRLAKNGFLACRALAFSRMRSAFSHASSSVSAMIGRSDRLKRIWSARPCWAAAARTRFSVSFTPARDSPHRAKDVGIAAGGADRRFRRAAEVDRQVRLLHRLDGGEGALEAVVFALVVDRLVGRPDALDDVEVLAGAGIAGVLVQPVAVAPLLLVVAAGDDVHRQASAREGVERRQRPRGQGRRHESGPVGQQDAEPLGVLEHVAGGQVAVRRAGMVGDQHPVEAARLVRAGDGADIGLVDRRPLGRVDLGDVLAVDDADELDGHGITPSGAPGRAEAAKASIARLGI